MSAERTPEAGDDAAGRTQRRPRSTGMVAAVALLAVVLAAVLLLGRNRVAGGDGPVVAGVAGTDRDDGMAAMVGGRLRHRGDCLTLEAEGGSVAFPVVWPPGTRWDAADAEVVLADGRHVAAGASVTGGGGFVPVGKLASLPDIVAASAVERLRPCVGATGEVAVLHSTADLAIR